MILTCPACETRYQVDDDALGKTGRRVRCASCGNVWHFSPEAAAIQRSIAEVTAEVEAAAAARAASPGLQAPAAALTAVGLRAEPALSAGPGTGTLTRPAVETELPAAARRRRARLGWLGLIALAVVVVLVAVAGRERIMGRWPQATPVYQTLRLTEPPGTGLEVTVSPSRTSDSLVIEGNIVNTAGAARRVPRLRVALRDGNKVELEAKVIDPPVDTLPPGGKARFNTTFEHPSITATGVAVTFSQ